MTLRSSSSSSRASSTSSRSRRRPAAIAIAFLVAAFVAFACDDDSPQTPLATSSSPDATATALDATVTASPSLRATATDDELLDVLVDDVAIRVETAVMAAERAQGLSDRDSMPPDVGMLFVFEEERVASFTMRRMRFPLDFIWISADRRVVDLTENVPNPSAPDEQPLGLQPSTAVLYVIEVNAGFIAERDIAIGDEVTFERDPAEG